MSDGGFDACDFDFDDYDCGFDGCDFDFDYYDEDYDANGIHPKSKDVCGFYFSVQKNLRK